jgi:hypothetical protein
LQPRFAFAEDDARAPADADAEIEDADAPRSSEAIPDVEAAIEALDHEPRVDDVVAAALRHAGLGRGRVDRLIRRARGRNAIPVMRLGARRGQRRDVSASQTTTGDRTNLGRDDDLTLEANLTFDLRGLAFAPEEVSLARERRAEEVARRELVTAVVSRYFERRRLQLEERLLGRRGIASSLRIRALEVELDALTGGAFTRALDEATSQEGM